MQTSAPGANTRSRKTRQQDTRRRLANNQQNTTMGTFNGPVGPLAWSPMTTEYQEKFLPPQRYKTIITTSRMKEPYHSLKGTSADICTFRSSFVDQNCRKIPPQAPQPPQPSVPLKDYRKRASSVTRLPVCTVAPLMPPKQDFVTVYQSDFQPWVVNKLKPHRLKDNFNIKHGLVALDYPHEQEKRSTANSTGILQDVSHPVQPRPSQVEPPEPAAASFQPKAAPHINQERLDESSDFFDKFQSWSLETKFDGQPKEPSQPEHHWFVQMTHKSHGTKPILPSVQTSKNSAEPVRGNTMKEDCRAWSAPQVTKKPSSGCPKLNNAAGSNSNCDATNKLPFPKRMESLQSSSHCTENEVTRMFWSSCLDTGKTGGGGCVEPPRSHHCPVSRRN